MLDLSNNNSKGHNFNTVFVKAGQRRLYLKRCQGVHYIDTTFPTLRSAAVRAGLKVGEYDFLEPLLATPTEAVSFLFKLTRFPLKKATDLRIALDCEYGKPSARVGKWVEEVANDVAKKIGARPLIYGSGYYLQECHFTKTPGPLWLAAYGRNDGREYPVGKLPSPWKTMTAHQYTDKAHVIGINGECDLSHVFIGRNIDMPKR